MFNFFFLFFIILSKLCYLKKKKKKNLLSTFQLISFYSFSQSNNIVGDPRLSKLIINNFCFFFCFQWTEMCNCFSGVLAVNELDYLPLFFLKKKNCKYVDTTTHRKKIFKPFWREEGVLLDCAKTAFDYKQRQCLHFFANKFEIIERLLN